MVLVVRLLCLRQKRQRTLVAQAFVLPAAIVLALALALALEARKGKQLPNGEQRRRRSKKEKVDGNEPQKEESNDDCGEKGARRNVEGDQRDVVVDGEEGIHRRRSGSSWRQDSRSRAAGWLIVFWKIEDKKKKVGTDRMERGGGDKA
jgi:hypothetical protein